MADNLVLSEILDGVKTLREQSTDTVQRLARLETILVPVQGQPSVVSVLDARISLLEKFRYKFAGALMLGAAIVESAAHFVFRKH